jgi:hypothetical protein
MVQRSLVTALAALGALLIVLGGIFGFLLSLGRGMYGGPFMGTEGAFVYGLIAVILGVLILVCSGYTHYQGVQSSLMGGLTLIVLGAVTWAVVGGWLLVAVGSMLAILAGVILSVEVLVGHRIDRPIA